MHLENSISGSYLVCNPETVSFKRSFFFVHYKYNIFFIQSGEMCIELWIYKDFYKISERGTTGAQHPPDVSGSEPCYHQGNFYW